MAKPRPLPVFGALALLLAGPCSAFPSAAQDEKPAAATATPQDPKQPAKDPQGGDPLRILWLKNPATGELVPVPGLTIEEYDKLDRIRRGLPPEITAPPGFVLTNLKIVGKAKGASIACELHLEVELRDDKWVRIPLGLSRAALQSAPSEENWLVTPDTATDGLVLWAKGKASEKKNLKLQFDYPLEVTAELTRLQIPLPRARASSADLTIEANESILRMEGAGAIDASKFSAGVGEIRCSNFPGSLDLSWRPKSSPTATAPWLEAQGIIELRVDGRSQIRADAKLRIRSFGATSQPLRIKLPKGMRLRPDAATISPFVRSQSISQSEPDAANVSYQTLELNIDPSAPSDFELHLQAVSDGPIASNASELSLGGFEVLTAKRHWGIVDLLLTSDWYVSASQAAEIRRVDVEQAAIADPAFNRARFEYAAQGAHIAISARLPRTLVEPAYDVYIESGQLRLEAQLKYRFRGPSAGSVEIDLADWDLERISSPDAAFLVDDVQQNGSRLIIPLSPQPLASGAEANLRIEVRRPGEESKAQFRLPAPKASAETPAVVRVMSEANLEITPRASEFKGVSLDSSSGVTAPSPQQRSQFVYRTRPGQEPPFLAFDVQLRKQSLLQGLATQLTVVNRRTIAVQHEIQLNVAYEPLREVSIDLPLPLSAIDSARVTLDEQPLERRDPLEQESAGNPGEVWTRCTYALPQSFLGPLKLVIQYSYNAPSSLDAASQRHLALPKLFTMSALQSKPHQLLLRDPVNILEIDSSSWARALFDDPGQSTPLGDRYTSLKPQSQIAFKVTEPITSPVRANHCDKWWLQTVLADGIRNDRLCIRMNTWSSPLKLRLPEGLVASSVIAAIDGAEIPKLSIENREITLTFAGAPAEKARVIELWYQCETKPLRFGSTSLESPTILEVASRDRLYWQLLAPADWYSLLHPPGWTLENAVPFQDALWRNTSGLDQINLEKWVGATSQQPAPGDFNHYLFSSTSPNVGLKVMLAPRRELWLVVLGAAFTIGALIVHWASLRKPLCMLTLAAVAALVVVFQPQWSAPVAQFIIIALAVTLVIWLLRWILVPSRSAPLRPAPSRSSARSLDSASPSAESVVAARRGSSISSAPAPAGPAP